MALELHLRRASYLLINTNCPDYSNHVDVDLRNLKGVLVSLAFASEDPVAYL